MLFQLLSSTRHQLSHLESWNKSYQGGNYLLEITNNRILKKTVEVMHIVLQMDQQTGKNMLKISCGYVTC